MFLRDKTYREIVDSNDIFSVIINKLIVEVVILDKVLNIIAVIFFGLPLIISTILVLMFIIANFRKHEIDLNKFKAAGVGILSVIITSLVIITLPSGSLIDTIGTWIVRFLLVFLILFTMVDTYEEKTNGIKAISAISVALILFSLIPKMATYLGWI